MDFNEYYTRAIATADYPLGMTGIYPVLGLAGEAGEVAEKIKKFFRDGKLDIDDLALELGDVLWYVANVCKDYGISMEEVAIKNVLKVESRKERNKIHGSGDKR